MCNGIASTIFMFRNIGKVENGDIGRVPVAGAQCVNIFNEVAKYNKTVAKGTEAASNAFRSLAESSKVADYALKGVNWATKHINPLICVSGVVKVARTKDDKTSAAIEEASALGTMMAGEKCAKAILPKLIKCGGKTGAIAKGLLFVGASMGSYSVGEKLGKDLAKTFKANISLKDDVPAEKINQIA